MDKPKEFPKQGDIITINFNPSAGREIQKRRPALVVSTDNYNLVTGLVAVCPITSTKKEHFIPLNENHQIKGYVNALQVKTLDYKARHWKKIEKATLSELGQIAQTINMIFSFDTLLGE
ncbi:type II toxin-antitoxin system PemK/MazF family toxin [Enterococcus mundtii]|uniref:type II toxin-antitoxin system PemK/MazF family toxin n=1 Tax=Enterococcus mundtii TaxID=53346 RepID=UPI000CF16C17|nr:type II toxin-antitoxin system PemK/MazF family toxin [Enterococcus mundtii]PQC28214.1 type II toxin-antitoxin system PemK/MazF family toxin [Enterococcus mundtii]